MKKLTFYLFIIQFGIIIFAISLVSCLETETTLKLTDLSIRRNDYILSKCDSTLKVIDLEMVELEKDYNIINSF